MRTAADRDDKGAETAGPAEPAGGLLITGSFAGERTTVEALRLEDGLTVWWYDSRLRFNDLACHDGMVFVASSGRPRSGRYSPTAVVALRATDGAKLWHVGPKQVRRRMVLRRVIWGLQALWRTSSPRTAWQAARPLKLAGNAYLSASDDAVLACVESVIFAFDARTGALRWVSPVPRSPHEAHPYRRLIKAHGSMVYVHGERDAIDALDARTGKVRWSSEGNVYVERLTTGDRYAYIPNRFGRAHSITALRVADGRREHPLALADREVPARVTSDGIVYTIQQARIRAVRVEDGEELWRSAPLRNVPEKERESFDHSVHVVASEKVIFYGYDLWSAPARFTAIGGLDASSGARLWDWRGPDESSRGSSGVHLKTARGNVYAILSAGIYAFSGMDGRLLWQAPGGVGIAPAVLALDGLPER